MQKVLSSLFEALYLLQKNSFGRYLYYLSHMLNCMTLLNMVVGPEGQWPHFLQPVVKLLLYLTAPVELLGLPAFGGFFVICVVFVLTTVVAAVGVTHSRYVGEEGATWKAKILRTSLGVLGKLILPPPSLVFTLT